MDGIKNLLSDTHGVLGIALIIAATVLTAVGIMPLDDWKSYSEVIFVGVAGAHAAISVGDSFANRGPSQQQTAVSTAMDAMAAANKQPTQQTTVVQIPPKEGA